MSSNKKKDHSTLKADENKNPSTHSLVPVFKPRREEGSEKWLEVVLENQSTNKVGFY